MLNNFLQGQAKESSANASSRLGSSTQAESECTMFGNTFSIFPGFKSNKTLSEGYF